MLDGLRDPGNAGTILRSAEAAACAGVLATTDTVDLYSPKVVRAAMGAHFALPVACDLIVAGHCRVAGRPQDVYVAEARTGAPYYEIDWTEPAALVIGNETEGPRPRRCTALRAACLFRCRAGPSRSTPPLRRASSYLKSVRQRYEQEGE